MPETIARIASLCLALAFAWAATAKITRFGRWRATLGRYGFPRTMVPAIAVAVPLLELVVVFVTIAASVRTGAIASLVLLVAFSLAIVRARAINGDRLPCGCFGGTTERHYSAMLVRNAALAVLAVVALGAQGLQPAVGRMPTSSELVPVLLVLAGVALILWVLLQTSRSLQRRSHQ